MLTLQHPAVRCVVQSSRLATPKSCWPTSGAASRKTAAAHKICSSTWKTSTRSSKRAAKQVLHQSQCRCGPCIACTCAAVLHRSARRSSQLVLVSGAHAAGFSDVQEPEDMFWGDRVGHMRDPYGHLWRVRCAALRAAGRPALHVHTQNKLAWRPEAACGAVCFSVVKVQCCTAGCHIQVCAHSGGDGGGRKEDAEQEHAVSARCATPVSVPCSEGKHVL